MTITLAICMFLFSVILQSFTPYLLKDSLVFGVTIPESHLSDKRLAQAKKHFTLFSLCIGAIIFIVLFILFSQKPNEDTFMISSIIGMVVSLLLSQSLFFVFRSRIARLKEEENWRDGLTEVRVVDLSLRQQNATLPTWSFFTPVLITMGLLVYTWMQYDLLPEQIPTHWGINGQPDAFTTKSPFSAISMLLILLIIQGMMAVSNYNIERAAYKLNPAQKMTSRDAQIGFKKYSSWFLLFTVLAVTILLSFLHLSMIHSNLFNSTVTLISPIVFIALIFIATALYSIKVGQSGSRLSPSTFGDKVEGVTTIDEDQYWKLGLFYFNKEDPSLFVEKRFGVGWSINFSRPLAYVIIFLPLVLILAIAFLL